jgi:Rrf2 family protein
VILKVFPIFGKRIKPMLNKATKYAIWVLVYTKKQNDKGLKPGIEEIARKIGGPRFYIAKILQKLVGKGIINSVKGKAGGYFFDMSKPEITIKALMEEDEIEKVFSSCVLGLKSCCPETPCVLNKKWCVIMKDFDHFVSGKYHSVTC